MTTEPSQPLHATVIKRHRRRSPFAAAIALQIAAPAFGVLASIALSSIHVSASAGNTTTNTTIVGGENHSLVVKSDGTVWSFGYNYSGSLGDGTNTDSNSPVQVLGPSGSGYLTGITSVAAGGDNSVAPQVRRDRLDLGRQRRWRARHRQQREQQCSRTGPGSRWDGQLGRNHCRRSGIRHRLCVEIGWHDLVLGREYEWSGWRWHDDGAGLARSSSRPRWNRPPVRCDRDRWRILSRPGAQERRHSMGLGSNSNGQLGNGTTTDSSAPVQVVGLGGSGSLTNVTAVAGGFSHSLALIGDGTADAWGYGGWGQLGNGNTADSSAPVQVSGLIGADQISASGYTSVARTGSGVLDWGYNGSGQLGDGSTTDSSVPVAVQSADGNGFLSAVAEISEGDSHALALMPNGALYGWGHDYYGQLGNGNNTYFGCQCEPTPVQSIASHVAQPGGPQPPGAVGSLSATGGNASATATWSPVAADPAVTSYAVAVLDANANVVAVIDVSPCTTCSYAQSDLNNGQSYYFAVAAKNPGGYGPEAYSNVVTPPAPTSTSPAPAIAPAPCLIPPIETQRLRPLALASYRSHKFTSIAPALPAAGLTLPTRTGIGMGQVSKSGPQDCKPGNALTSAEAANDLKYRDGTVEAKTTVYLIFWEPTGDAPADPNYNATVIQFYRDLVIYERQHQGHSSPYFDILQQYYQISDGGQQQNITGQVSFGGAVLDGTAYRNGFSLWPCNSALGSQTNMACLGDGDIATEADAASQVENWPETNNTVFLVFVGQGAVVCSATASKPSDCSPPTNAASGQFTCGYHAANVSEWSQIYGAIAYPIGGCKLNTATFPNGSVETDSAISIGSHEMFEAITDPFFDGWCADAGYDLLTGLCDKPNSAEIGDQCNDAFGLKYSTHSGDLVLNGDEYLVQEEWSNRTSVAPTELDEAGNTVVRPNKCALS